MSGGEVAGIFVAAKPSDIQYIVVHFRARKKYDKNIKKLKKE